MNTQTNYQTPSKRTNGQQMPTFFNMINDILQNPLAETVDQGNQSRSRHSRPAANVVKTEDAYLLQLAAPGFKKKDFAISVNDGKITISSEVEQESNTDFQLREFSYGSFSRSFTLPKNVDTDSIVATYANGILNISIPVLPEAKPKTIEIK